ncbi:MAG: hypothetical protein ACWGN2_06070 [Anaerolineales bacterium]
MKSNSYLKDQAKDNPNRDRQIAIGGGGSYEIKVAGHLDEHWSQMLGGLAITHDDQGCTRMRGIIPDQAALHGILGRLRELGLTLIWLKPWDNEDKDG